MKMNNLHVNKISFSYEGMGVETRFKKEAKLGNSEIAEIFHLASIYSHISEALLSFCKKKIII